MALAETAELAVKLTLGGNFLRQMGQVNKQLKTLDKESSRAYKAGTQIGTGIKRGLAIAAGAAGLLATQVALGLDSLIQLEKATAQTEAVIKSTGGVAGVTADEIRKLSEKYEALNATVGDEVIQSGQNLLLTFTAITKEGFEPALAAALDLSTAMGTDLDSAIKTVGKALSEPDKAMARLRRQGIILTKSEEKQIKAHMENNDTLAAQDVILKALDKRYGGSFLAGGSTTAGKVAKFTDSIEDLQRALATALLPAVGNIADALTELLADPEIIKGAEDLGREIGNLFSKENIKAGAKVIGDVFTTLRSAAPAIKSALGTIGTVLRTAFDAFNSLPAPIQQLLIGGAVANKLTGGLVTNIAGGIFGALKAMTVQAAVVNVTGGVVNGGGGGPGGIVGKASGGLGAALGGGAALGAAALAVSGAIVAGAAIATQKLLVEPGLQSQAQKNIGGTQTLIDTGTATQLKASIDGLRAMPDKLNPLERVLYDLNANGVKTHTEGLVTAMSTALASTKNREIEKAFSTRDKEGLNAAKETKTAIDKNKTALAARLAETKRETARGTGIVSRATSSGASMVASAVRQSRPIITTNVYVSGISVQKKVVVSGRYGSTGGSKDTNTGHAAGTGPLP